MTAEQDGFDLDLSYVTRRVIVHGFPATGVGEHFLHSFVAIQGVFYGFLLFEPYLERVTTAS